MDREEQEHKRPMVSDVDPHALAVDAMPDAVRVHGDADETEEVMAAGDQLSTEELESGEEK